MSDKRVRTENEDPSQTPRFGAHGKSPNIFRRLGLGLFGSNKDNKETDDAIEIKPSTTKFGVDSATGKPTFAYLPDLAAEAWGGKIVFATDEFYGKASNLLASKTSKSNTDPVLDAWTTRRRRTCGHDWVIIKLAEPTYLRGIDIDTTGLGESVAPNVSIEGGRFTDLEVELDEFMRTNHPDVVERSTYQEKGLHPGVIQSVDKFFDKHSWTEVIALTRLKVQDSGHNYFYVDSSAERKVTHIRLNVFPDGSIRRFRAYGECGSTPALLSLLLEDSLSKEINLATPAYGGAIVWSSVARGPRLAHLLAPWPPGGETDSWIAPSHPFRPPVYFEDSTGKPRFAGEETVVIKLAARAVVTRVEIDTTGLIGCVPARISLFGQDNAHAHTETAPAQMEVFKMPTGSFITWAPLAEDVDIFPDSVHDIQLLGKENSHVQSPNVAKKKNAEDLDDDQRITVMAKRYTHPLTHVQLAIVPDGGIARIRVFGQPVETTNPFIPKSAKELTKNNRRRSTTALYSSLNSAFKAT